VAIRDAMTGEALFTRTAATPYGASAYPIKRADGSKDAEGLRERRGLRLGQPRAQPGTPAVIGTRLPAQVDRPQYPHLGGK